MATGLAKIKHGSYNGKSIRRSLGISTDWPHRLAVDLLRGGYDHHVFRSNCHTLHGTYAGSGQVLSNEERVVALHRMKQDAHGATTEEDVGQERFNWHWIRMALLSPNTWSCSLAWFFLLIPLYVGSSRGSLGQGLTTFRAFRHSYPRLSKLSATL